MSFSCGIVGLPNVGKSTLFNAISNRDIALVGNYPFCTIEPNEANVFVPDSRLNILSQISNSNKIVPCNLKIVDIAGLVKGASKGEGLGSKFLSNIREVDAIIHVLRCFESSDIVHTSGKIDPIADMEVVNTELLIADMEVLSKYLENAKKKKADVNIALITELLKTVENGIMLNTLNLSKDDLQDIKSLGLLTLKPCIYVANVDAESITTGNALTKIVFDVLQNQSVILSCSDLELQISRIENEEEKKDMQDMFGLKESTINNIIRTGYSVLNRITFFTSGVQETRAWSLEIGSKAPKAAGVIHSDFEKGFIKAECMSYDDFIKYQGEAGCKEAGRLRLEGKDYIVNDGDIMHFKFNV